MRKFVIASLFAVASFGASAAVVCTNNGFGMTQCYDNSYEGITSGNRVTCQTNSFGTTVCY